MTDLEFIQQTLQLAAQGKGLVSPNPLVGSLVVKDGRVVGQGFHRYAELKHAEVWALEEAGTKANGATIYVNRTLFAQRQWQAYFALCRSNY